MRRPRAARQDCPTEMWSSPVFFCRNGPCGQQKSPGGLAGPSGARQRRAGPLPQGIAIDRRFWEVTFWGITKDCDAWPKGSAGRLPGAFGGWGFSAGTCRTWPCACAPSNIPLQTAPCLRPAQPCQQHHGAHRTASLNLFSLPLFHPASPVFCAVLRWFFSIISHPCCNLPESRGECTSVPLAPALKTV